jgi:hypothetical protein
VTVALTVTALDVSDALAIGWDAFTSAAGNGLAGWEIRGAAAEVQPGPPLPGADVGLARILRNDPRAERQRAGARSSAPIRRAAGRIFYMHISSFCDGKDEMIQDRLHYADELIG